MNKIIFPIFCFSGKNKTEHVLRAGLKTAQPLRGCLWFMSSRHSWTYHCSIILAIYCRATVLPQTYQPKTMHMYYLLARLSWVLCKAEIRALDQGGSLIWGSGFPSQLTQIVDSIQFLAGCQTEAPVSPWVGHPANQPFAPAALNVAACLFQARKKREGDSSKMGLWWCNRVHVITYLLSPLPHWVSPFY